MPQQQCAIGKQNEREGSGTHHQWQGDPPYFQSHLPERFLDRVPSWLTAIAGNRRVAFTHLRMNFPA